MNAPQMERSAVELLQVALFVPGDRSDRLEKALQAGADAVIADLEDAVAMDAKEAARHAVAAFLAPPVATEPRRWVRVNAGTVDEDLEAVAGPGLHAVMLPKCDNTGAVARLAARLDQCEQRLGMAPGSIRIVPLIESAAGVLEALAIARAPRVLTLAFGSLDYALDLGLPAVEGGAELLYARSHIAHAARVAGLLPPLDGVWAQVRDAEGVEADTRRAYALGMGGKLTIHPAQVAPVRRAFAPSPAEVEWAEQAVAAYDRAMAQGLSAIRLGDRFIDPPVVLRAQRVLRLARGSTPGSGLELVERAVAHGERIAVTAPDGTFSYRDLADASAAVAGKLLAGAADLKEMRVAFLTPPGFAYVAVQWGIWRAGGIAVPLATAHPPAELAYVVENADVAVVIAHPDLADRIRPIALERGLRFLLTTELLSAEPAGALPQLGPERRAMIIYTSGTTSRPKGVVTTHGNIRAQVTTLVDAWGWRADDHIPLILPLHHIHGIINVLTCALWSGAHVTIAPRFDADATWQLIAEGNLSLFMAVPTMYSRLIAAWEAAPPERQAAMSAGCRAMRLMVSGSAALPVTVLERWQVISGHVLLERYGMTEIGMGLANPLDGRRRPGYVGMPLRGVDVRLVDEAREPVAPGTPGEIEVKGPSVFLEYWRKPEATREAFHDGWFRTGDVAVVENESYRILGRSSVDIIKSGGYKVSALEIEEVLRNHPLITDCAVVGLPDPTWGERIGAAVVLKAGGSLTLEELRTWGADHLAAYKLPTRLLVLAELPRNAMGKVTKPDIVRLFSPGQQLAQS